MENKRSFLLYCDIVHTVKKLSNDQAGELFKHLLSYVNDENPVTNDPIIELVFEPIKQQLKRDLRRWESIAEKRRESGRLGGLKSGEVRKTEANEASALKTKQTKQDEANEAVNVNVNVNGNVNGNVIKENKKKNSQNSDTEFYPFEEFWNDYGKKVDTRKCQDKWSRIGKSDRALVKEYLPYYILSTPDIQFRKNPITFLNNKCWADSIIPQKNSQKDELGYNESFIQGKRMYNRTIEIPAGTRPCPGNLYSWSTTKKDWVFN